MVRPVLLAAAVLLLVDGAAAFADPPGRVGRLSYMEGTVSYHDADQEQWSPATLNYPLTTGDALWTEPGAKAEVQVGPAEIRLDQSTALDVLSLDDQESLFRIGRGALNIRVHALAPGGFAIETRRGTVNLLKPGRYRIDAGQAEGDAAPDSTEVAVFEGQARLSAPHGTLTLEAGEKSIIGGDPATLSLAKADVTPFDAWALDRERRAAASETERHVSPQVTGYQDLDAYGHWETVPEYGTVWYPRAVAVDWAPYRYGHWVYRRPWGWTWIDDAPWGFAPFHYGRWVLVGHRWCWWPGRFSRARPVYAPALVAFVGGSGWSFSLFSGGAHPVGWVPLAPYEVFRPYYRTSATYIRNVNVTTVNKAVINNITIVNDSKQVRRLANRQAATAVPATAFTTAQPVHKAKLALPSEQLATAKVTGDIGHLRPAAAAKAGGAPSLAGSAQPTAKSKGVVKDRPGDTKTGRDATSEPQTAVAPKAPAPVAGGNEPADRAQPAPAPRRAERAAPRPATAAAPEKSPAAGAAPAPSRGASPDRSRAAAPGPAIAKPQAAPQPRAPQPQAATVPPSPAPLPSAASRVVRPPVLSESPPPAARPSAAPSTQTVRQKPQQIERPAMAGERPAPPQMRPLRPTAPGGQHPRAQAPQAAPQPEAQPRGAAAPPSRPGKGKPNDKRPEEG